MRFVDIYVDVIKGDQKVSVHLTISVQSSGAQRLFDHSVLSDYMKQCLIHLRPR